MKYITLLSLFSYALSLGQSTGASGPKTPNNPDLAFHLDLIKQNDSVAVLIPFNKLGKFGFIDQARKLTIPAIYSNVGFFTEDCNLLNSSNEAVIKYGSADYASVRLNGIDYRIDTAGRRVYTFTAKDLGKCTTAYRPQIFQAYVMNNKYGLIETGKYYNSADENTFKIYPQYDYLYVLEGDDLRDPMIIAVKNDKFGIIDIHNTVIIPFEYDDIKRNYSWKLARLFEVTKDGKPYYYVDRSKRVY